MAAPTSQRPNHDQYPSMNMALFVYWILPLFGIALFSRTLHTETPITIPVDDAPSPPSKQRQHKRSQQKKTTTGQQRPGSKLDLPSSWPTSYRETIQTIHRRRRHIPGVGITDLVQSVTGDTVSPSTQNEESSSSSRGGRTASSDPTKNRFQQTIAQLVADYEAHRDDIYKAIAAADAMRIYDLQFHEGGTYESEALKLYDASLEIAIEKRQDAVQRGEATNQCSDANIHSVSDEVRLDYPHKSLDGLLCGIYTAMGKVYFMANMFERAVEAYDACLEIAEYLDARNSRGSSLLVLGKYKQAAADFLTVIKQDDQRIFIDAFTGIARVLEAKDDAVEGGWEAVTSIIEELIPYYEKILQVQPQSKEIVAGALNRLHHTMFIYHESKTKDYPTAIEHLNTAHKHKLSILPEWKSGVEKMKIQQTKNIFRKGFWTGTTGSQTKTPIFIIGFVRSGSTLLERILDAHPAIAGTGENSIFNGRLDDIRNQIVKASNSGQNLSELTRRLADDVVDEMYRRWELVQNNTSKGDGSEKPTKPLRLADKMLTNYYNVGFIEMLYPNALILHVAREPMDSIFSAYKHEFPPGTLDYTSDYTGLSDLYHSYRDIMEHWDEVLPGRVTHIRYEDMVQDFEGVARKIIDATGLPWDDSVLEFHKKKHAVNTLSSTQVRKGVYQSSMKSWMRYEEQLAPLVEMIGDRTKWDLKTTLPGYSPPQEQPET